jgi:hypothetical protein
MRYYPLVQVSDCADGTSAFCARRQPRLGWAKTAASDETKPLVNFCLLVEVVRAVPDFLFEFSSGFLRLCPNGVDCTGGGPSVDQSQRGDLGRPSCLWKSDVGAGSVPTI